MEYNEDSCYNLVCSLIREAILKTEDEKTIRDRRMFVAKTECLDMIDLFCMSSKHHKLRDDKLLRNKIISINQKYLHDKKGNK